MTGVLSKSFVNLSDLVAFMNTVAVTTVVSLMRDDASNSFVLVYQ